MNDAFICDAVRTPIGSYGGKLSGIRTDDLAALPIKFLMARNSAVDWGNVDDVIYGCANQAGEDNRIVARLAGLLGASPMRVHGMTINRPVRFGVWTQVGLRRGRSRRRGDLIVAAWWERCPAHPMS